MDMELTFIVTRQDYKKAKKWINSHNKECKKVARMQWEFSTTGIGEIVGVRCTNCLIILDLTDVSTW